MSETKPKIKIRPETMALAKLRREIETETNSFTRMLGWYLYWNARFYEERQS